VWFFFFFKQKKEQQVAPACVDEDLWDSCSYGTVVDGPPVPRRPPELPGRMSVPGKLCGLQPAAAHSVILSLQKCSFKTTFLTPSILRHTHVALFTDLGPAVASLISSGPGPRTSSPSTAVDGVVS